MSIIVDISNLKKPERCRDCPFLNYIEEDDDHLEFYTCPFEYYKQSITKTPLSLNNIYDGVLDTCPVKEVLEGEWTFDPLAGDWVCSECNFHSIEYGKYCPNCGAKMRIEI